MCLAVPNDGGISFTDDQSSSKGMRFFDQTFSVLQKFISVGSVDNLAGLLHIKFSTKLTVVH